MSIFEKASKVITSCRTIGQLQTAQKYIELLCKHELSLESIWPMQALFQHLNLQYDIVFRMQDEITEKEGIKA